MLSISAPLDTGLSKGRRGVTSTKEIHEFLIRKQVAMNKCLPAGRQVYGMISFHNATSGFFKLCTSFCLV